MIRYRPNLRTKPNLKAKNRPLSTVTKLLLIAGDYEDLAGLRKMYIELRNVNLLWSTPVLFLLCRSQLVRADDLMTLLNSWPIFSNELVYYDHPASNPIPGKCFRAQFFLFLNSIFI